MNLSFYKDKKILITGHTGFKGAWMCRILIKAGANIIGYSLDIPTNPSLYELINLESYSNLSSVYGDVRDLKHLYNTFMKYKPDIVIHMAAQPIVLESYRNPVVTFETNIMGTVNMLECVRNCESVKSVINVTTDKVYKNKEWVWGYRENEELNGYDPYSNSKSCSELVTSSYINSFFKEQIKEGRKIAVSTMRAGNVIGGGDFATNRIIPDCIRSVKNGTNICVRNPYSIRPYQHVLEPVMAYLLVAQRQYEDISMAGNYNIGPNEGSAYSTERIVNLFCDLWNKSGKHVSWEINCDKEAPHEANILNLDCTLIKKKFLWHPVWNLDESMIKIVEWSKCYLDKTDMISCMDNQIDEYLKLCNF